MNFESVSMKIIQRGYCHLSNILISIDVYFNNLHDDLATDALNRQEHMTFGNN
jgi:hypothetical protein